MILTGDDKKGKKQGIIIALCAAVALFAVSCAFAGPSSVSSHTVHIGCSHTNG